MTPVTETPQPLCIQYLTDLYDLGWDHVFTDELITKCRSSVEYAAAILYADYRGLRVLGAISPWIRRLRYYPLSLPPSILSRTREILHTVGVTLTDNGELITLQKESHNNER